MQSELRISLMDPNNMPYTKLVQEMRNYINIHPSLSVVKGIVCQVTHRARAPFRLWQRQTHTDVVTYANEGLQCTHTALLLI